MALILFGIFFGNHFSSFLNEIGFGWLYHEESGVYADCSKAANRNNPYCISRRGGDSGWRNLKDNQGDPSGFSLN
jgi:hypothetical protein